MSKRVHLDLLNGPFRFLDMTTDKLEVSKTKNELTFHR